MKYRQRVEWGILWAVLIGGAVLRLWDPGFKAFRADEIMFPEMCRSTISAWRVFFDWIGVAGRTGQLPLSVALTKGLVDISGLPVDEFSTRLVNLFLGIATLPFAYLIGREMGGRRFGILVAALMAISPFHLQLCREAYFYSALVLGSAIETWCVLWAFNRRDRQARFPAWFHVTNGVGFLVLTYSHYSGWLLAAVCALLLGAITVWRWRKHGVARDLVVTFAIYGVVGVSLLVFDWGVPYLWYNLTHPETKEQSKRMMGENTLSLGTIIQTLAGGTLFGGVGARLYASLAVLGAGFLAFGLRSRARCRTGIVSALVLLGFAAYWITFKTQEAYFAARHVSFLLPGVLALGAAGLWAFVDVLALAPWRLRWTAGVTLALEIAALGALAVPAWLAIRITGSPTPYKEIRAFCNESLPPGTVVLVDRWLEPWNELKVYNATNVFFAFTIPSEPVDVFLKYNWRQTAMDFFAKYPDAAYLEISKYGWTDARIGPWDWPRQHFKRHVQFRNEAGLRLDTLGLLYRTTEPTYKPGLVVDLFHNTRDDVISMARADGRSVLALYGHGWGYTKLWQQIQGDFRDWRVLEREAVLDVYNLTAAPTNASVRISAVALNGTKRMQAAPAAEHAFTQGQMETWRIEGLRLEPGLNRVVLRDASRAAQRSVLLVADIAVN